MKKIKITKHSLNMALSLCISTPGWTMCCDVVYRANIGFSIYKRPQHGKSHNADCACRKGVLNFSLMDFIYDFNKNKVGIGK